MISYVLHRNRLQISAGYTNEQKNRAFRVRDYFLLEITIAAPASATPASARPAVAPVATTLSEAAAEEVAVVVVPDFEDVAAVEVAAAEDLSSFLESYFLDSVPEAVESVLELDSSATGFF